MRNRRGVCGETGEAAETEATARRLYLVAEVVLVFEYILGEGARF